MSLLNEARISTAIEENEIDLLIATTLENVNYATNYRSFTQELMRGAEFFAVIPKKGVAPRALIAPVSEIDRISEKEPEVDQIYTYGVFSFKKTPKEGITFEDSDKRLIQMGVPKTKYDTSIEALLEYLRANDFDEGHIGIDEAGIGYGALQKLRESLPKATIRPAYSIWQWIRMVKTGEEIERLRKSISATEAAFKSTLAELREGVIEKDLERVFNKVLIDQGARPAFAVIAFGPHGAYPNAAITNRKLKKGDVIRYDIGCTYQGYYSDISRTVCFGTPSKKLQDYYHAIQEGEEAAIAALRPGQSPEKIFDVAVGTTRKMGISDYERNHVGHGIGIEIYDPPVLRPKVNVSLQAGMVFCVETPYYEIGWMGIQVEDTVVVNENGAEYLTTMDRDLVVV